MDKVEDLWYVTTNYKEISNLARLRCIQVSEQSFIDRELDAKCKECPNTVIQLLMLERRWNRDSMQQLQDSPNIREYVKSVEDNCEKISNHQERLKHILFDVLDNVSNVSNVSDTCSSLQTYLDNTFGKL